MAIPAPYRHPGSVQLVRAVQPRPDLGPIGFEAAAETDWFHRPIELEFFDDFLHADPGNAVAGALGQAQFGAWTFVPSAGGLVASAQGVDDTSRAVGVFQFSTGTSGTGRAGIGQSPLSVSLRTGIQHRIAARVMVPTLSAAAQEFHFICGLHDGAVTNGTFGATNGIWFAYHRAAFGDFWSFHQANNGSQTNRVTTTPVTAGEWVTLEIEIEHGGTTPLVWSRINGVLVNTAALQLTAARTSGLGVRLVKSNGTTARSVFIDWIAHYMRGDRAR